MKLPWRRGEHSLGQSLVEFALILPILALFLVIAVDFGRIYFSYIQVTNAAREGAVFGSVSPTNTAGIDAAVRREVDAQRQTGEGTLAIAHTCKNSGGAVINCTDATSGSGPGNTITVAVSEPFSFMTPLANSFLGNFIMKKTATAIVLGYAPPGGGGGGGGTTCTQPVPSFNVVVTTGLTIHVDPTASTPKVGECTISGYNWTWGNGNDGVGSAYGDDYTYANAGIYTITLETTNQAGATYTQRSITVPAGPPAPTCAKPTANFTWTQSGKTYDYRDASTVADPINCPITDWLWTFTGLGGTTSNAQNPAPQTYGNNSSHPVTLKVTNAGGTSAITKNS